MVPEGRLRTLDGGDFHHAKLFDGKIKQRTFIAASPERVYDTITSAQEWDSFFTTGMQLEARPGGRCVFAWSESNPSGKDWGPDSYTLRVPGRVLEAERPSRFTSQWGREGGETTVRIELNKKNGGTVVTLTEDGYKDDPDGRAMILECASGWGGSVDLA